MTNMFHQFGRLFSVNLSKVSTAPSSACLHLSASQWFFDARDKDHDAKAKQLMKHQTEIFDQAAKKAKDKKTYQRAVLTYLKHEGTHRRGHVEFIYAALDKMEEFSVHKDLDTYKKILSIFPTKKMVPTSFWQVEFMHYPKQQQCCIDILEKMERNAVLPDDDMGYKLKAIFGTEGHAFRKYQRMMYWMPKFKHANPYKLPQELPEDPIECAILALKKMAVDLKNKISVHQTEDLKMAADQTYIVYAQSPKQQELISGHAVENALFVEGGYPIWIREKVLTYFVLRADASERIQVYEKYEEAQKAVVDDVSNLPNMFSSEEVASQIVLAPNIHEQEDGTILAMCITGTSSKNSLISWIKFLQETNPKLKDIPVLFSLRTPDAGIMQYEKDSAESSVTTS